MVHSAPLDADMYRRVDTELHAFLNLTLDVGVVSTSCTNHFMSGRKPWNLLDRRLGGSQNQSGWYTRDKNFCSLYEVNTNFPFTPTKAYSLDWLYYNTFTHVVIMKWNRKGGKLVSAICTRWFKYDRDWVVCKQAALRSSCATLREWSHNLHPPSCSG